MLVGGTGAPKLPGLQRLSTLLAVQGRLYVGGDGKLFSFTYAP